jgi:hypothetical protein
MMRYARAVFLSVVYLILMSLLWKIISGWFLANVSPARVPNAQILIADFGNQFIYLNTITFAVSLFWLARTRMFAPVGRYLVPTVLGVGLSFVLGVILLILIGSLPSVGPLPGLPPSSAILFYADSIIPGIVVAQLFRFPRPRLVTTALPTAA